MNNDELLKTVKEKAEKWLGPQYDEETRKVVKEMLEAEDKTPLIDAFYKDLEFRNRRPARNHGRRLKPNEYLHCGRRHSRTCELS